MFKKRVAMSLTLILSVFAGWVLANGQIQTYRAHLSAEAEDVETKATGQTIFHLSKDGSELSYKLIVANLKNTTQAHIHLRADASAPSGGVVVWLYPSGPPSQLIEGRFSGVLAEGTITSDDLVNALAGESLATLIEKIEEGLTYVNVHTQAYPGGEIRGDIQ